MTQDYIKVLLAEYLKEITFFGLTQEEHRKNTREIRASLEKSLSEKEEGIPMDQAFRELEKKHGWPHDEKDDEQDELRRKVLEAEEAYNQYGHSRERMRILESLDHNGHK